MLAPGRRVHRVVKWDFGHRETLCPWRALSRPVSLGHRMYCLLSKMLALLQRTLREEPVKRFFELDQLECQVATTFSSCKAQLWKR